MINKIILISYYFPPMISAGSNRPYQVAKYMLSKGRSVQVVKNGNEGTGSGFSEIYFQINPIISFLDKVLFVLLGLIGIYRPQRYSWQRTAEKIVESICKECASETIELYCTYPTVEVLSIGLKIKERNKNVYLTAEFRDGLFTDSIEGFKAKLLKGAVRKYKDEEDKILMIADKVITVSDGLSLKLIQKSGRKDIATAMNGFSKIESSFDSKKEYIRSHERKFVFLHSGSTIRKEKGFIKLCDYISRYNEKNNHISKIQFVQLGNSSLYLKILVKIRYDKDVTITPAVPRERVLHFQKNAGALIILKIDNEQRINVLTGKLFEYLFAGSPIICFMPGTEAEKIIDYTGTGITLSLDDIESSEEVIEKIVNRSFIYSPNHLDEYAFNNQMDRLGNYWE